MDTKKVVITGTGIKTLSHLTRESEEAIKQAQIVLHLVNEPLLESWITQNAKKSYSLEPEYFSDLNRIKAYKNIKNKILELIEAHHDICIAIYGHPLLLSDAINEVILILKDSDVELHILPSISSFDCLLSDLKINTQGGCYSIEASELIFLDKFIDKSSHLILWQIGMIGVDGVAEPKTKSNIGKLQEKLLQFYPKQKTMYLYEASIYPHFNPEIIETTIDELHTKSLSGLTTGYIPPEL